MGGKGAFRDHAAKQSCRRRRATAGPNPRDRGHDWPAGANAGPQVRSANLPGQQGAAGAA
jgi:hypothetical protein